ncbi:hypothetical protein CHUAL_009663 [Chamberlinius hualienensis]
MWAASLLVLTTQDLPRPLSDSRVLPCVHQCCIHPSLPTLGPSSPWFSALPVPFPSLPTVTIPQLNSAALNGAPMGEPQRAAACASLDLPVVGCSGGPPQSSPAILHVMLRQSSPRPIIVLEHAEDIPQSQDPASPDVRSEASSDTQPLPPVFWHLVCLGTPDDPQYAENLSLPFASGLIPRGMLWAELGRYKKCLQSRHFASRAKDKRYAKAEREVLNLVMGPGEVWFLQEHLARKKLRAEQGSSKAPAKKSHHLSPQSSSLESGDPPEPST